MTEQVDHILLTRFNLPTPGHESYFRQQPGWLEARVDLFETYCLPSVRGQRDRQFSWLIYFDPDSPDWFKSWVDRVSEGTFIPKYRYAVSTSDLREDIDSAFPVKAQTLVSTNLDNDDGLGLDFVARLRRYDRQAPREALYFGKGLILSPAGLYLRQDRSNAFCSVAESWDDPLSCWVDWHNRLRLTMPTAVLGGEPQWLQVVHGTNVSNRARGRLVSPIRYVDDFIGLDGLDEPSYSRLWSDRLVLSPARALRDGSRASLRRAAVAALGTDRVGKAKATLAGLRHRH